MSYYIDDTKFTLQQLKERIIKTDLVPSRKLLLDNIDEIFDELGKQKISSLAELRKQLKTPKIVQSFSEKSGVDEAYLTILRREIESYFPKPFPVSEFNWLPKKELESLINAGLKNSKKIYEALSEKNELNKFCNNSQVNISYILKLICLLDLTRIQWVSPMFALMLFEAGYDSFQKVTSANAEELCEAVDSINKKGNYFKGKVGLRDIKRLINSAKYLL